ncbi:MAG: hypothetical protein FJ086_11735 [Deltaproteobacteria bacterium]|nr:hypothetical protein [Deltaproteobacteria bacterium]
MNIVNLMFRVAPVAAVVYGTHNGAIQWHGAYGRAKGTLVAPIVAVELGHICNQLLYEHLQGGGLPGPWQLRDFIRESMTSKVREDSSLDLFGQPYQLELLPGGFQLRSAGPDEVLSTEDDITVARRFPVEEQPE